jgi:flagellar basal-body rod protein FlgB
MLISELTNSGAMPSLELMVRFAGQRQRIIAHNIANIETPEFRPVDASPREFQRALAKAVDERRARTGGEHGALSLEGDAEVRTDGPGGFRLTPKTPCGTILFHDRNNRDLERLMQDSAENLAVFRVATDLLRNRQEQMRMAIGERV